MPTNKCQHPRRWWCECTRSAQRCKCTGLRETLSESRVASSERKLAKKEEKVAEVKAIQLKKAKAAKAEAKVAKAAAKAAAKARRKVCVNCGGVFEKTQQCSRCKQVRYCSEKCQRSHWKSVHKKECV